MRDYFQHEKRATIRLICHYIPILRRNLWELKTLEEVLCQYECSGRCPHDCKEKASYIDKYIGYLDEISREFCRREYE